MIYAPVGQIADVITAIIEGRTLGAINKSVCLCIFYRVLADGSILFGYDNYVFCIHL